jgi:hypothetical protein
MSLLLMKSVNKYSEHVILSRLTFGTTPLLSKMRLRAPGILWVTSAAVTGVANPSNSADVVLSRYQPQTPLLQPSRLRKAVTSFVQHDPFVKLASACSLIQTIT